MRESLYTRVMEYFADTSPRVQYLMPRRAATPRQPFRLFWIYPMPLGNRVFFFFFGLLGVIFGSAFLAFLLFIAWGMIFN
jgi:hypothetical protein